ncbi:hypothetical protein HOD20_00345 [archaeon]|nr:hypothetical protein [archaeon]MBT4350951.1 hypothetical protein [archaeon]MBT4647201.1 hypothetical protein [archaeon]MBT6822204.1 hypothetical protein [archaeon]MBT7391721.1 hypothetical protein [archaeon]
MKKRGEKSLQMIFGLMMLLIISLVVLTMFFKFSKKGTGELQQQLGASLQEAAREDALIRCQSMCNDITDDNSLIDYCSAQFTVDWDKNGLVQGPVSSGKWWFCEERIPCFVLVEKCKRQYDGNVCRNILAEFNTKNYYSLHVNLDASVPDVKDFGDGCALPTSTSSPDTDGQFPTQYNWKERFCFANTFDEVNDPNFECNNVVS